MTKRRIAVLATLLLIIAAGIALRLRFVDVPLNRDEGEYAYGAQLLLQGVPPYTRLYSMRWPGVYAGYAGLITVFGATGAGIHTGLAMLGAVTTLLIFLLGRRLFGTGAGLAAAAVHALLSTDGALRGFAAYSEHFVVVLVLAGLALMLHAVDRRHRAIAAVAGIALGCAVTMKQPGIFFLAFAVAWMLWQTWRGGKPWVGGVVAVVAGAALPVIAMLAWLAATGVLGAFAFWTVTYASEYVAGGSVAIAVGSVRDTLWPFAQTSAGPLLLAVAGVVALWWEPYARPWRAFIAAFVEIGDTVPVIGPHSELEANMMWGDLFGLVQARDRKVIVLLRKGLTHATEIAQALGYKNHSPVSKALARIRARAAKYFDLK